MSIITMLAHLIAWFAARQVDDILGKWIAYFTIAFQNAATERAKTAYRQAIDEVQRDLRDSYGTWDAWRKKVGIE